MWRMDPRTEAFTKYPSRSENVSSSMCKIVRVQIILKRCKVSSIPLLSIEIFYSIH